MAVFVLFLLTILAFVLLAQIRYREAIERKLFLLQQSMQGDYRYLKEESARLRIQVNRLLDPGAAE